MKSTLATPHHIVNDVTQLNPVEVWAVATPTSIEEVRDAILRSSGPISIGGGRFSMGGQTASPGSLHLDMRRMNQVVSFSPLNGPSACRRASAGATSRSSSTRTAWR